MSEDVKIELDLNKAFDKMLDVLEVNSADKEHVTKAREEFFRVIDLDKLEGLLEEHLVLIITKNMLAMASPHHRNNSKEGLGE